MSLIQVLPPIYMWKLAWTFTYKYNVNTQILLSQVQLHTPEKRKERKSGLSKVGSAIEYRRVTKKTFVSGATC